MSLSNNDTWNDWDQLYLNIQEYPYSNLSNHYILSNIIYSMKPSFQLNSNITNQIFTTKSTEGILTIFYKIFSAPIFSITPN